MSAIDLVNNGKRPDWSSPATGGATVTQSDTVADANGPFRGLYIGVTGTLKVTMVDGSVATFTNVAAGVLAIAVLNVWTTVTTATGVVGLR